MPMIAWLALYSWPVFSIVFYRKLALPAALCATLLGGYLLLPNRVALNLPLLPVFSKATVPTLCAIFLTWAFVANSPRNWPTLQGWMPRDIMTRIFLVILLFSFFASAMTNGNALVYGLREIPGLTLYDAFSQILEFSLIIAPLFLARKVLSSPEGNRFLLLFVSLSGLIYSLPALYEVRMSPQLHSMVYGFFPHSFAQHMRGGGFRPVVFLNHGLALGIYTVFALLATACLFRTAKDGLRLPWFIALVWMMMTLVLSKSLGALMIALVILPIILFFKPRTQIFLAACIAGTVLTYPALRSMDIIPVDRVLAFAEMVNPSRADSLNTRIINENALLEKASQKPLFGWGGWGRNRVFGEAGENISITDGEWIIVLGVGGWFRYLALFGLLCWPVVALCLRHRTRVDPVMAALALILCAKLVDMLPNSGWISVPWLIAGALLGRMELLVGKGEKEEAKAQVLTYARSFPEQEARRAAKAKPAPDVRPGLPYKRPSPSTGYRK